MTTFETFQATKEWTDDLGTVLADDAWTDDPVPARGWLYLGSLYIDEVLAHWPDDCRSRGRWHLLIERDEWITDDLELLERKLYAFAVSVGYVKREKFDSGDRSEHVERVFACNKLALAFRDIAAAANVINEVLSRNEALNNAVPTNWPLGMSADEFAAECYAMADHYEGEADEARALTRNPENHKD